MGRKASDPPLVTEVEKNSRLLQAVSTDSPALPRNIRTRVLSTYRLRKSASFWKNRAEPAEKISFRLCGRMPDRGTR